MFEDILISVLNAPRVSYIPKILREAMALVAIYNHGHRRESNPRSPESKMSLPMGAGSTTLRNVAVALVEKVCLSNFIAGGNG